MHHNGLVKILLYLEERNLNKTLNETESYFNFDNYNHDFCRSLKNIFNFEKNKSIFEKHQKSVKVEFLKCNFYWDLLKNCTSFKEKVMKKFINQKERRMNFSYKGEK